MDEKRWNNTDSIEIYLAHAGDPRRLHVGVEDLPVREQMEEMMFLGLRMMEGVRRQDFQAAFGVSLETVYKEAIRRMAGLGLLADDGERIFLTRRGISLADQVSVEFMF